jgi:flagellar hook protein FlgE
MDVIGNNIANVNTYGFKQRRVAFDESFSQLMKGASRTDSKAGGTNPMQVGLGVNVGSIDVLTGQGNLQNTGRIFDLSIEGAALFGVSDGKGVYYTRNGIFDLDSEGYIVLPANGMILQGKMADSYGNFPPGTGIGNLKMPLNQQAPAKETTQIGLNRNLNSEADAKGNIVYSQQFLHPADGVRAAQWNGANDSGRAEPTSLVSLHNSNGVSLDIRENDIITITWFEDVAATLVHTENVKVARPTVPPTFHPSGIPTNVWDIDEFKNAIQMLINNEGGAYADVNVNLLDNGSLEVENTNPANGLQIFNLQISSDNPKSNSYVNNAFNFGSHIGDTIDNYSDNNNATCDALLRPAEQFDYIYRLTDGNGRPLQPGLETGDNIDVFGLIGKNSIQAGKSEFLLFWDGTDWDPNLDYVSQLGPGAGSPPTHPITGNALVTPTTLDDLLNKIRNDFKLPLNYIDINGDAIPSVSMNGAGTDDKIPDGSIMVYSAKGTDFAINSLQIKATNSNSNLIAPTTFNSVTGSFLEKRAAEDVGEFDVTVPTYDESGAEHWLTITFLHTGKNGEWLWRASYSGKEYITPGSGSGMVTFGQDGTVSSWIYDNGGSQLQVDPRNGSNNMNITLNVGRPGDSTGITQFASPTTINTTGQDGYPSGNLIELTIDEFGLIEGTFSNGTSHIIAQIMAVDFANPAGLMDLSDSIYTTSANSGDPIWGLPGTQSSSKLRPGALEMSNVDLANEFTTMITTQKGYQANSRIITVSDTLLEELVNLKR